MVVSDALATFEILLSIQAIRIFLCGRALLELPHNARLGRLFGSENELDFDNLEHAAPLVYAWAESYSLGKFRFMRRRNLRLIARLSPLQQSHFMPPGPIPWRWNL
jgi:hypothetical protein